MPNFIADWLTIIDGTVPPFCVELVLRDSNRYFVHSISAVDKDTRTAVIRIWDLRAFSERELDELKSTLNTLSSRSDLNSEADVHPKLDWANLRVYLDDVLYCIEWHDRLWPEDQRPSIGFSSEPGQ